MYLIGKKLDLYRHDQGAVSFLAKFILQENCFIQVFRFADPDAVVRFFVVDGAVETKNLQTLELIGSIEVIFEQAGLYIILFRDFLGGEWNAFLDTGDNSINNGIKFFIKELIVNVAV